MLANMKKRICIIAAACVALAGLSLSGCIKENLIPSVIPDGNARVTLGFDFEALNAALSTRGVKGDLDFEINDLVVLFYKASGDSEDGKLLYAFEFTQPEMYWEKRTPAHCEETTYHGNVSLDVPYGDYRIYAAANVRKLMEEYEYRVVGADGTVSYELSEKQLREIQIPWPKEYSSEVGSDKPASFGVPDAMFGYFTREGVNDHTAEKYRNVIHHNLKLYPQQGEIYKGSLGLDHTDENLPKPVTIDKNNLEVQAWLKRVVSKLTVGFDGNSLKSGVEIYIKSVSIRYVAATCFLGHDNSVGELNDVENITVDFYEEQTEPDQRLNIIYSTDDGATGAAITQDTPAYPRPHASPNMQTDTSEDGETRTWNPVWYDYVHGNTTKPSPEHDGKPITLYFMENLQGVAEGNPKINDSGEKDGRPNGTYVEVKAYYRNTGKTDLGKKTAGEITYRFMLGKNITNDFNAERNCHYKLILSFVGDANNPDWHIDYEEKQLPYFRIPYNLEDGGEENGFTDEANSEVWHKNENWNHSWVWYAYDNDHNPIAEIAKEIVYYDSRSNGFNITPEKNNVTRKFYQVVTVYPIKDDGETDLKNGIVAQVLACDTDEAGETYYTKKGGANISMYYRYEINPEAEKVNNEYGKYGYFTIKSSELTNEIAKGTDGYNRHENYLYVEYDPDTKKLALVEKPSKIRYETRPYTVQDYDNNKYPIVKIGASYWFRENLRTIGLGGSYSVSPYEANQESYNGGEGCLYVEEAKAMYKTVEGDSNGEKFGLLYNLAAIAGSEEFDPWMWAAGAWSSGEFDQFYEPSRSAENVHLVQFDTYMCAKEQENEWQITPKGWHIVEGGGDFVAFGENGTRTFGDVFYDHQYLMDYLAADLFRAVRDKDELTWPNTDYVNNQIKQKNLSGLSLLAILPDGEKKSINYNVNMPSKYEDGMIIPYWTDSFLLCAGTPSSNSRNLYPYPVSPFFTAAQSFVADYGGLGTLVCQEQMSANQYHKDVNKFYIPVRPVRHSFKTYTKKDGSQIPSSYMAQSWDDINGNSWVWSENN